MPNLVQHLVGTGYSLPQHPPLHAESYANTELPLLGTTVCTQDTFFPLCNAIQIDKILQKRVAVGFNEDVFEGPVIPKIAGIAAQEHGDIRKAINLLRATGEIASSGISGN